MLWATQIKLVMEAVLFVIFGNIFRDTTKNSYYQALVTQDLKFENFECDVKRFIFRSEKIQESIEKVIA